MLWFLVGCLIAGLMFFSQWSDVRTVQVASSASLIGKLRRRGVFRMVLGSLMLFAIFYYDAMFGVVALVGFWLCRSVLLVVLNRR